MANRVKTAKRFIVKANRTYDYIIDNWGVVAAEKFAEMVNRKILLLRKYPEFGRPSSKKPNVRRLLVGKQNLLYYSNKKSKTSIHNMFSSYGDPNKNPYG
jgi:plasmid stabilization system protein ParE